MSALWRSAAAGLTAVAGRALNPYQYTDRPVRPGLVLQQLGLRSAGSRGSATRASTPATSLLRAASAQQRFSEAGVACPAAEPGDVPGTGLGMAAPGYEQRLGHAHAANMADQAMTALADHGRDRHEPAR